ncbi:hypothetical protein C1646_754280 [Rhizophagus diaphanus]|nr:hypothetical protein C1646_754280 [Rhizophagus diaphanus] [Rhizophagus sp. MUCL 43196]
MAKWWIDSKRNKKYYVLYDEIKEPGIPLDEALELYSESMSGEAICPNKKRNKVVETFLSPNLFKGSQDKSSTADATSKPADEDADVTLINELGLLGRGTKKSSAPTEEPSSNYDINWWKEIESAESKNEDCRSRTIPCYFDFGEAIFNRIQEVKTRKMELKLMRLFHY